jgi:hypothetical protein
MNLKRKFLRTALLSGLSGSCVLLASSALALSSKNPEQETAAIAKTLRPIGDDEWKEIAGDHAEESYQVVEGDTLYDLSKRLFGDSKYWPKIWALNNGAITNPHYILPGNNVAFVPGTGTSLPSVGLDESGNSTQTAQTEDNAASDTNEDTDVETPQKITPSHKSKEWKNLPKQPWEEITIRLPPEVDPDGFDRRSQITIARNTKYTLPMIAATKKVPPLGRIIGSETETDTISMQDIVFISSKDCPIPVQVGQRYAISDIPYILKEKITSKDKKPKDPRQGLSYPITGIVKIIDQKDGLYLGVVEEANLPIYRGATLIPNPDRIAGDMTPIAGPSPITGSLIIDPYFSTSTTAQHKFVFVNRGSDDGLQLGMMFRAYQHDDLDTQLLLTKSNLLINADLMVVQMSEKFSTLYILHSDNYIVEGAPLTLLTDVSELKKPNPLRRRIERINATSVVTDDLDQLDDGAAMNGQEKRELKQLETFQGQPVTETPPPPADDKTTENTDNTGSAGSNAEKTPMFDGSLAPSDSIPPPPPTAEAQSAPDSGTAAPPPPNDTPPPPPAGEEDIPPPSP